MLPSARASAGRHGRHMILLHRLLQVSRLLLERLPAAPLAMLFACC